MKNPIRYASLLCLALFATVMMIPQDANSETQDQSKTAGKASGDERLLRHVVMFKFKEEASDDDVRKIVDAFRALPSKIPSVHDFEYGTNNSPEGLANGFTHCFLVTFTSEEGRAEYLPHPAHKEFVQILEPHLDKVLVVDYWASK